MATSTHIEDKNRNKGNSGNLGNIAEDKNFGPDTDRKEAGGRKEAGAESESSTGNVKSFLASKAKSVLESTGVENWQEVKDRAGDAVEKVRHVAGDYAGKVGEQATAAVETVSSTVRRYPFPAVLVGFGVGIALGTFLSGRRRY